ALLPDRRPGPVPLQRGRLGDRPRRLGAAPAAAPRAPRRVAGPGAGGDARPGTAARTALPEPARVPRGPQAVAAGPTVDRRPGTPPRLVPPRLPALQRLRRGPHPADRRPADVSHAGAVRGDRPALVPLFLAVRRHLGAHAGQGPGAPARHPGD